jgi:hypothetical protein
VAKELEEWFKTRDVNGLRIAVTDGVAPWDPEINDFDWETVNALPKVLKWKVRRRAEDRWPD